MRKRLTAGRLVPATAALALALGAAACGGDNANNNANSAANRAANSAANAAGTVSNSVSNAASSTANAISNATSSASDTAIKNTVQANLTKYNVTGVEVEVKDGEVTLKGSVPRAKIADAMKAANEASPKKVNNQLSGQ